MIYLIEKMAFKNIYKNISYTNTGQKIAGGGMTPYHPGTPSLWAPMIEKRTQRLFYITPVNREVARCDKFLGFLHRELKTWSLIIIESLISVRFNVCVITMSFYII